MQISVPTDLGGELRKLEGVAVAQISDLMFGKSKAGHPKMTIKYLITEEMDSIPDGEPPTIGEPVLETYSLQSKALWKLNNLYKDVTGERIPQGDIDYEEFQAMLIETLIGKAFSLILELEIPGDGSSTDERTTVTGKTYLS